MHSTIFLVRHGKTKANLENRFAGRSSEPLHPVGIDQIHQVAEKLAETEISAIYCGPLPRTVQSAEILGEQLAGPVVPEEGLNEIAIPHWDTLTKDEIRRQFGDQYPTWIAAPHQFSLPNCETIAQVQERAVHTIENIFASHEGENVLLVSHLIVIRSLILYYRNMEIRDFRSVKVDNGSVVKLERDLEGRVRVA
jgi:broad specificity phosphatase PhoE